MSETFGKFLHKKRTEKNLSLRYLSYKTGVSSVYLSNIEKGLRSAPSGEILKQLAFALELNSKERIKLYDLAAATKNGITLPYDITCYINSKSIVKDAIRIAETYDISEDKWKEFIKNIS